MKNLKSVSIDLSASLLDIAIRASVEAGKAIMEVYGTDFSVEKKEDKSPLTEADRRANFIIISYLSDTNIPIISEENRQIDFKERKRWDKCWIVDPVDGTKEFIMRNGEFTVNIALVNDGVPVLGVIYVPVLKVLYYSDVLTNKSFKVQISDESESLDTIYAKRILLKPKLRTTKIEIVGSRSHMNDETREFIRSVEDKGNEVHIVSRGSSLKFCLIAEGEADIYPRFAPTMEWDTAAGQAICSGAGVEVISHDTGQSLLYNKKSLLNPWFVVGK